MTDKITVKLFEVLISAVLESTLGLFLDKHLFEVRPWVAYAVAEKSRTPASEHTAQALPSTNCIKGLYVAFVQLWVNLAAAFDKIQWRDSRVGQALGTMLTSVQTMKGRLLTQARSPPTIQAA